MMALIQLQLQLFKQVLPHFNLFLTPIRERREKVGGLLSLIRKEEKSRLHVKLLLNAT